MSCLPPEALSLKQGPMAQDSEGRVKMMKSCYASPKLKTFTNTSESLLTINIHLLCISKFTLTHSDPECVQRSTGAKNICGIKTLEKAVSGEGFLLRESASRSPSQSSQSIWRLISSKTIVSLHRPPNSKQNVLARCLRRQLCRHL